MRNNPEILCPVGDLNMCLAAIHNNADAIYVGVPGFNARGRSTDHEFETLKEMIELCHLYNVKVNLAFNILIFENELKKVTELLYKLIPLAPDAFIVQDIGLLKLIKKICPEQIVHASTQMTVTSDEAIELLNDLDIKRFVLGREVSINEMKQIRANTEKELEVFVHGALCVAYSGQCLTSEALGGRSANRGQCAQSCRFDYDLFVDGSKQEKLDKKYLVSPKDLCGLEHVNELVDIGIDSFKIEGRLKGPAYVASTANSYYLAKKGQLSASDIKTKSQEMAQTFSRGFYPGWLNGVNHQELVDGHFANGQGLEIGKVVSTTPLQIKLDKEQELSNGDGISFLKNGGIHNTFGGNIYNIKKISPSVIEINLGKKFNIKNIVKNMRVFLNKNNYLENKLHSTYLDKQQHKKIKINIEISISLSKHIKLRVWENDINSIFEFDSDYIISEVSEDKQVQTQIEKEFNKLGNTPFQISTISVKGDLNVFIPPAILKKVRQKTISEYIEYKSKRSSPLIKKISSYKEESNNDNNLNIKTETALTVLIRSFEQLKDFLNQYDQENIKLDCVYLDYEYGKDYRSSIELVRNSNLKAFIATTRILKPNELHHLNLILRLNPDGILVRNIGALNYLKKNKYQGILRGDFSLNITNHLSGNYFIDKGLESITSSYDLNELQLQNFINLFPANCIELTIHQYMPEFHMEHCVFAAFLSNGTSFKDCGKPCEKHQVEMKDPYGNFHVLKADQECRNTMFNQTPQATISQIIGWVDQKIKLLRLEALNESGTEFFRKVKIYNDFINKNINIDDVKKSLGVLEKYGITSLPKSK